MPLPFDNRFIYALPGEAVTGRDTRQITGALYARVAPEPLESPYPLLWSAETAAQLGLPAEPDPAWWAVLAGNALGEGSEPYATVYGGHQFGCWAGQLGDGRAINLGEVANRSGERWTLQLKGAGATPYSRNADGLAVLRSSIREHLCSEAMFHLGVPTTRSLSLVT